MEQEGEKGREEKRQVQRAAQPQQQQPQHQKCPRCDSMNTKFCYFNNYSLSQPRHFCKTCKRYWTHGGTFRNIPVGGGSRKAKRGKTTSSSSSSNLLITQPQQNLLPVRPSPPLTSPNYYNLGGGGGGGGGGGSGWYFPFHSMNNTSQPFNQYLKVGGGDAIDSSGSSLVSGFNNAASSLPPRFQQQSLYPAQQRLIPSSMASHSGPQSLINNVSSTNHRASTSSDASLWSATNTINATSSIISGNSGHNNIKEGSSSSSYLIPNHWLHRPGFGPPQ